jgi:hypothetical protein
MEHGADALPLGRVARVCKLNAVRLRMVAWVSVQSDRWIRPWCKARERTLIVAASGTGCTNNGWSCYACGVSAGPRTDRQPASLFNKDHLSVVSWAAESSWLVPEQLLREKLHTSKHWTLVQKLRTFTVRDSILRLYLNVSTPRVTFPSRADQVRAGVLRKNTWL